MFKIMQGHMTLWLMKRGPKFIQDKLNIPPTDKIYRPQPFDINSIIPEVDQRKVEWRKRSRAAKNNYPDKEREAHNAVVLLRSYRNRGENIYKLMRQWSVDPVVNKKRQAMYSRWWRKIWRIRRENKLKNK